MTDTGRTIYGGGGASLGLPEPNFSTGWGPGFAVEGHALSGADVVGDYAYQLDDATQNGTDQEVDDDWFHWDPIDSPTVLTIKRTGFYWIHARMSLTTHPTDGWAMWVNVGNATAYSFVPGGTADAVRYSGIVPIDADTNCKLQLIAYDNVGLAIQGTAFVFVPLFA